MPCGCCHWKPSELPIFPPITLDALVGGVGNVCALSSDGRPMFPWEGSGGCGPGSPIEWWWCCIEGSPGAGWGFRIWFCSCLRRSAAAITWLVRV